MEKKDCEIVNGKIISTTLGFDDHGFVFHIVVEGAGYGVVLGGIRPTVELIGKVLNVVDVSKWEDLNGKYVRIKTYGLGSIIHEMGNIIEDKWIDFNNYEEWNNDRKAAETCKLDSE